MTAAICLASGAVRAQPAAPTPEEIASARIHFQSGREYFIGKLPRKAFDEFVEAFRLAPRAELLYNRALCLEALGLPAPALACYRAYVAFGEGQPGDAREEAEGRIAELGRRLGRSGRGAACPTTLALEIGTTATTRPMYRQWWPWTILGVGVAAIVGVAVGVSLTRAPSAYTFPAVQ